MSGSRTTAAQLETAGQAGATPTEGVGPSRALGWSATAAIIAALLIMIATGLLRRSWMPPVLPMPASGPPWELAVHVSARAVIAVLWAGGLLGAAGVVAGLIAVRRGMPLPIRTLMIAALTTVAILVVLPPAGSTDALDYAVYGHIAALGHSPYVMTPRQYSLVYHVAHGVPADWADDPSYYGPLATAEQLIAAKLAGASLARTVFWLKLWNAIAFAAVALTADRMFRADRASRLRAHLLWTVNPLMIWSLIAAGHLDVLAAAVGVAGLLIVDRQVCGQHGRRPWLAAAAAGLCVGAAADIKVDYLLFVLAIGWALRRRPGQLLAAACGAAAVLLPSYAVVGTAAVKALAGRAPVGMGYAFYGFFLHRLGISLHNVVPLAACLAVPLACLALARMPAGFQGRPAVRAALALSVAWLLLWPHQFAWYSVIIICVLAFYPASRLDWIAVAWLSAITIADMPGLGIVKKGTLSRVQADIQYQNLDHFAPLVMLGAVTAFVILCINQRWDAPAPAGGSGPGGR